MAEAKYTSTAFNDIYNDTTQMLNILDDNVDVLSSVLSELDEMDGAAITGYTETVDEFLNAHDNLISLLETTQQYMNDFKLDSDAVFKPINENNVMSLDVNAAQTAVSNIIDVVKTSLEGSKLESPSTTSWINQKHQELDDGGLEALLNPMDEFKQRNCEAKFRKNEKLYKEAMSEYLSGITFEAELEELSMEVNMYKSINADILMPMHEVDLYEGYLTSTIGNTAASNVISMENKLDADLKQLEHEKVMNNTHTFLDVLSLVPIIGEVADAANAIIYLCEGDLINAGISALSLIPVAGSAFIISKHGDEVLKASGDVINKLDDLPQVIKEADTLIDTFAKSPLGIINSAARGDVAGIITGTFGMVTSSNSKFTDEVLEAFDIKELSISEWVFDGINYIFN